MDRPEKTLGYTVTFNDGDFEKWETFEKEEMIKRMNVYLDELIAQKHG